MKRRTDGCKPAIGQALCWLTLALLGTALWAADERAFNDGLREKIKARVAAQGFESVEEELQLALEADGPGRETMESLAHVYLIGKRPDSVVLLANRIPDDAEGLALRLASIVARGGFPKQADQLLVLFLSRRRGFSWKLTAYRATLFNQAGRHDRAIALLEDTPRAFANEPRRHYLMGIAYQGLGKPTTALDHIRTALEMESHPDYIFTQGLLLLSLDRPGQADRVFRQGRQRFPQSAQLCFGHARVHSAVGDFYGAESLLKRAVELEPGHGKAHTFLARMFYLVGDWDSFPPAIRKAIELEPGYYLACYYYGQLLLMDGGDGHREKALEFFRRSVRSNRNFTAGYVASGQIMADRGSWKEALDYYRQAAETGSQGHRVYYLMAQAYRALGQLEEAERSLKKTGLVSP